VEPVLARLEATGRTWDLHLYWAARALVDSERPDPARAVELLEGVGEAIPSGWTVPVALLEARARRSLGEDRLDAGLERRAGEELRALERESAYELHALSLLDLAREDAAVVSVR
jgi:hypothetical protein